MFIISNKSPINVSAARYTHTNQTQILGHSAQGTRHSASIYINLQCINVPDKYIPDDRSFSGMSCIDLGATMS